MNVLLTGAHGTVGTAVAEHLEDTHELTYLDREEHPDRETVVADVAEYDAIRPAFDGQDAVVHLAADPRMDAPWESVHPNNIVGTRNALEAAVDAGVDTFVFASSNHAVGMYELDHRPEIYDLDFGLTVDHTGPVRPDSHYGVSKAYGEDYGRYYAENRGLNFYALRIGSIRDPEYDHPYGDAERGVERGDWERGSEEYETMVARMKALWHSRRDAAHLVDCCLRHGAEVDPGEVTFEIFYGMSDNERNWFDIDHARKVVGYEPTDAGEAWDAPPE